METRRKAEGLHTFSHKLLSEHKSQTHTVIPMTSDKLFHLIMWKKGNNSYKASTQKQTYPVCWVHDNMHQRYALKEYIHTNKTYTAHEGCVRPQCLYVMCCICTRVQQGYWTNTLKVFKSSLPAEAGTCLF